jgi:hypothetical protein
MSTSPQIKSRPAVPRVCATCKSYSTDDYAGWGCGEDGCRAGGDVGNGEQWLTTCAVWRKRKVL